jgi:hypothetical protein
VGFAVAAMIWLCLFITARKQPSTDSTRRGVGLLCQLATATGMAMMIGTTL